MAVRELKTHTHKPGLLRSSLDTAYLQVLFASERIGRKAEGEGCEDPNGRGGHECGIHGIVSDGHDSGRCAPRPPSHLGAFSVYCQALNGMMPDRCKADRLKGHRHRPTRRAQGEGGDDVYPSPAAQQAGVDQADGYDGLSSPCNRTIAVVPRGV